MSIHVLVHLCLSPATPLQCPVCCCNQDVLIVLWRVLQGIAQTYFKLGACSLRPPHVHQFAAGMLYVISGGCSSSRVLLPLCSQHALTVAHAQPPTCRLAS